MIVILVMEVMCWLCQPCALSGGGSCSCEGPANVILEGSLQETGALKVRLSHALDFSLPQIQLLLQQRAFLGVHFVLVPLRGSQLCKEPSEV